ncbi:Bromodomain and PHD finger-containing protein 3 [Spatholobus suberectus]|nr:Bromodomain and PHD finger-containing protein 3 [Spatholobus suberectus]
MELDLCDRKQQKTEGQRRSPRISALEAKAHDHSMRCQLDNGQGPAFRTRGKRNSKLRPLQQLIPSPNQRNKYFNLYLTLYKGEIPMKYLLNQLTQMRNKAKVGRRNQGDFRDSTGLKSSEIAIGVPSKTLPCSSRGTSNKRSFKANHGCSNIAKHVDVKDVDITASTRRSSKCRSFEIDRRCTYRPLSVDEDKSIFSTVYGKLKLLEHVSQQDIGYKDSLMLFVKDLGPIAQNIAKKKLLGCEIRTASTSAPCRPDTSITVTASTLRSQYPLD